MADTPQDGVSRLGPRFRQVEVPDEESSTNVTPPPEEAVRAPRPSLKRRITRPSFMIELKEGSPVGEYEIQEQIGEGAMGTVYSAVHPLIGKTVAIKVLKPELCANQASIDRFVYEAQAVNKIGHPNIVDVFSLGELADGRAYFVMEWLRGEDLKLRLARGPMEVHEACDILDGIARALDAAHSKQIVHRDLKPDNVFLHQVEDGPLMVKLLDFGIAKLVRVTPGTEKTQTGNMLGTPRYISPEQARGVQVDHRSDIYSLGVMAYEMFAGRPPFLGETAMDLVVKHLNEAPPPLHRFAKVPKALEQCVMAMLAKEADGRPSLEDVRAILVDPTRRLTPSPARLHTMPSMAAHAAPGRATPRWQLVVAAIAAIAVGVVTWKLVTGSTTTRAAAPQTNAPAPPAIAPMPTAVTPMETPPETAPIASPVAPARGTLDVEVRGSKDAVIFVDGKEWGRGASIKVELDPGEHEVIVEAPGREPIAQQVEINAGAVNTVAIVVPALPAKAGTRPAKREPKPQIKQPPGDDELLAPKRKP